MSLEMFLPLLFSGRDCIELILFYLKCMAEFPIEIIWGYCSFLFWKIPISSVRFILSKLLNMWT